MDERRRIEDSLLVLRCQQGDGEAFADLVARWNPRLWRHACRLTGNTEAAADMVQETWERVLKRFGSLADPDAFPGWVFRILTNQCMDSGRRATRRRWLLNRFKEERPQQATASTTAVEAQDSVQAILSGLTVEQRALLTLHYQEGFSVAEIADMLDVPAGTVKSRLYHARQRVRSRMEDRDHE
ncbi:MAG: RNA polymerase sigma factor [bacterium]|nr:RNA polymerase sigma factor [bacterium]